MEHGCDVMAVAFRPDGKEICAAATNGNIHIWDVEMGTQVGLIEGRRDIVGETGLGPFSFTPLFPLFSPSFFCFPSYFPLFSVSSPYYLPCIPSKHVFCFPSRPLRLRRVLASLFAYSYSPFTSPSLSHHPPFTPPSIITILPLLLPTSPPTPPSSLPPPRPHPAPH